MVERKGISSFSVLLLMAVTAVIGLACFSQLKVQYTPIASGNTVTVYYSYPGVSPRVLELEVTSKIEAVFATIANCTEISSISQNGYGYVTLKVDKHADVDVVRFEAASLIRNLWASLPDGCSFPTIMVNGNSDESGHSTVISFNVYSPLPSQEIARFIEDRFVYPLSVIEGVDGVTFYGNAPYEWIITFDADLVTSLGLDASQIASTVQDYYGEKIIGMIQGGDNSYAVKLRNEIVANSTDFSDVPVGKVDGRIIRLGEVATFRYQESNPSSYYRVNGLNTLELAITAAPDANILNVASMVRDMMQELSVGLPKEISVDISYDSSEYIRNQLDKIYLRTGMCLLIILIFVFIVNSSWRYMVVMALTLAVNILVSVALYYLFGLNIHIFTLAGITVSLGIIIDNSIVMIDHWARYHNRSVFPALFSAVLTTVAALLVILLLPEKDKENLIDFTYVIVINLCVSLAVSYLFVPALLDYLPIDKDETSLIPMERLRRIVIWNNRYERYIRWGTVHRWVLIIAFILAFGIPTCLLPDVNLKEENADNMKLKSMLGKIATWRPYSERRSKVDKILGSTFALFHDAIDRSNFYREPGREVLLINAGMPEGCSVQQLNEVMRSMENYLAFFDEIETFETVISSAHNGNITVYFRPESEGTWAPHRIKSDIISMAANLGGANWTVSGLDDTYFNNNIVTDNRSDGISLSGYNFDELLSYGEELMEWLDRRPRVKDAEIWGGSYYDRPQTEFLINYNFGLMSAKGLNPYSYYYSLSSPLFSEYVIQKKEANGYVDVCLESSKKDYFDAWHVSNEAVETGGQKMKLSEVGSIEKQRSGFPIHRVNQSYTISVRYNFIGSPKLADKMRNEAVEYMNDEILPIGYKADGVGYRWFFENKDKYAGLILLVIVIILVICAVYFDSIRYSLAIVWMVPISFVGVFLIFGLTNYTFDKGGFAAFVMLSGITVNAGIYLVSAWLHERNHQSSARNYIRAFNRKIWPISLTVLSTILGLVPFLFDGPQEVFWFPFAIGTIAGLIFSTIAFMFFLPVFCCEKEY